MALALVCRPWNAMVESTPILWSTISISDTITYVRKSLLKSGELPIDVYGAHPDPGRSGFETEATSHPFLLEVNRHARRWRHVTLPVTFDEGYAPSITFFPWLESLELHWTQYSGPVGEQYVALLNKTRIPYLREALLHTAPLIRWDISFPANLSKLEIQNYLPSSLELLSILATCPNLGVLRLGNLFPQWDDGMGTRDTTAPVVELAALQELELHDVSVVELHTLLTHLKFPEDCTISLRLAVPLDSDLATAFWTPAFTLYHERFQRIGQIFHVTVFVALDACGSPVASVRAEGWRSVVNLSLYHVHEILDAMEWFGVSPDNKDGMSHFEPPPIDSAAPNNVPVTTLEFHDTNKPDNINLRHLAPILNLRCITRINGNSLLFHESQVSILSYLSEPPATMQPTSTVACSEPSTERDGVQTHSVRNWAFPCLRELVLPVPEVRALKVVVNFAKSRSTYYAAPGAPKGPVRLRRIEFRCEYDKASLNGKLPIIWDHEHTLDRRNLLLELLELMDEEAELIWCGERILKPDNVE